MAYKIIELDGYLEPFSGAIDARMENYKQTQKRLVGGRGNLVDFVNENTSCHRYSVFHLSYIPQQAVLPILSRRTICQQA